MTRGKEYLNERYLGKYFFAQHENFGYENKQFSQHESYYFFNNSPSSFVKKNIVLQNDFFSSFSLNHKKLTQILLQRVSMALTRESM